jgi:type III secretory pathway component EscR
MKSLYILILLLYLPFQIQAQKTNSNPLIENVKQTFTEFQTSVLKGDKEWPNKYVDANSIQYFDHILQLIHQADSAQLMEEKYATILTVLYTRYLIPNEKISTIKNSYDLIYYLNTSVIKINLENTVIKDIKLDKKTAIVFTSITEEKEFMPYYFSLQNDGWKVNLIIDNENFEQSFTREEVMNSYGGTKEKIIESIVHERNWDNSDKNIWQPIP